MSMIYECPTCHAPQAAGRTACHECGAEFDGAVPDDATLPETTPPSALEVSAEDSDLPPTLEPETTPVMPEPNPPQLQEVKPPPAPLGVPAFQPAPFQPPPPYVPPIYPAGPSAPPPAGFRLPKAALIAVPVVLALTLGAVFFVSSMNQEPAAPLPSPAPAASMAAIPAPVTTGAPVTLSGGQSFSRAGGADSSAVSKWLVGRWQAKTTDYYVFNEDTTGLSGSLTGKQTPATFRWVLVQNQLLLNSDKQQKLIVSKGAGGNSIFLRGDDGQYVEYARVKASS